MSFNQYTPDHKTKIICTIGPASDSKGMLDKLMQSGMNIARLNFSHGDFDYHHNLIVRIREVAASSGRHIAIMGDLSGPKMRIGELDEPFTLQKGEYITLTTDQIRGTRERFSVSFKGLPAAVRQGDRLFLNDGFIQLEVLQSNGSDVECEVIVGGLLSSRKGLNLPGIDLGVDAFTENDQRWLAFAADNSVDAVSQSFVASAEDIRAVRKAADELGYHPFIIAKIERIEALDLIDEILEVTDGLMIARGDLGVEIPIERIASVQKQIMHKANHAGKPVITATQMLESMTDYSRPTRAEATDVANAILDGTDCVMLSGESAMGNYPEESVSMLARIAAATEPDRPIWHLKHEIDQSLMQERVKKVNSVNVIALSIHHIIERSLPLAVVAPTVSGDTARNITRFRLPVWIIAFCPREETCKELQFSYGVLPIKVDTDRQDWSPFIRRWCAGRDIEDGEILLTQGPSPQHPCSNHRLEIIELNSELTPMCVSKERF
ncbi:MAG: pyruvate kinase [Pseudomonadota bacterium]|nr:pyruvate kinase [Pseudomonadota bacterium]